MENFEKLNKVVIQENPTISQIQNIQSPKEQSNKNKNIKLLVKLIDIYIRTRRDFDFENPISYKTDINLVLEHLKKYEKNLILEAMTNSRFLIDERQICVRTLTPYQGKGRVYGSFHCKNCDKKWESVDFVIVVYTHTYKVF